MIRLAQVSDPHIGGDPDYRLAGVNKRRTFGIILDEVRKETLDTLMITGDIASDYSPPAYRMIDLHDDGRIETQVRRVDIPDIGVDTSCMGYE